MANNRHNSNDQNKSQNHCHNINQSNPNNDYRNRNQTPNQNQNHNNQYHPYHSNSNDNDVGSSSGARRRGGRICNCGGYLVTFTSQQPLSRGRRFLRCPNFNEPWSCQYFHWLDDPLPQRALEIIRAQQAVITSQSKRLQELRAQLWRFQLAAYILCGCIVLLILLAIMNRS